MLSDLHDEKSAYVNGRASTWRASSARSYSMQSQPRSQQAEPSDSASPGMAVRLLSEFMETVTLLIQNMYALMRIVQAIWQTLATTFRRE